MTPDDKRIAIAQSLGWRRVTWFNYHRSLWMPPNTPGDKFDVEGRDSLPELNLEWMQEIVKSLDKPDQYAFLLRMCKLTDPENKLSVSDAMLVLVLADVKTWAEAYLRIKGLWKD